MLHHKIERYVHERCCTLLGIGPMSKNCVDATIEISNQYNVPLFLVASRRQIEAKEFGGGYVNNWSTEEFAEYIHEKDKRGRIIMSRDHGGPWQNNFEIQEKFSLHKAMQSAKRSYEVDIAAGFEFIHIDPSNDIWGEPDIDEVLSRVFDLYEHCWATASRLNKKIFFEIGAEKQSGDIGTLDEVDYILSKVKSFCQKNHLPLPTFIVVQTGTKVSEMKNVGSMSTPLRIAYELPAEIQIPKLVDICNQNNILLKQHNTDYLNDETLSLFPKLGIHSVNVAPEFGTKETLAFIGLLDQYKLKSLKEKFLKISYDSKKWEKWMSPETKADDKDRAVIGGHYVFGDKRFSEIKAEAQQQLKQHVPDLDRCLVEEIKKSMMRYFKCFRLLRLKDL